MELKFGDKCEESVHHFCLMEKDQNEELDSVGIKQLNEDQFEEEKEEEGGKLRTLSGTIIPKKVKSMRTFFSGEELDLISEGEQSDPVGQSYSSEPEQDNSQDSDASSSVKRKRSDSPPQTGQQTLKGKSVNHSAVKKRFKDKSKQQQQPSKQPRLVDYLNRTGVNVDQEKTNNPIGNSHQTKSLAFAIQCEKKNKLRKMPDQTKPKNTTSGEEMAYKETPSEDMDTDHEELDCEIPDTMDVRSVFAILDELRKDFKVMKDDLDQLKRSACVTPEVKITDELKQQCKNEALQNFADDLEEDRKRVETVEESVKEVKLQNKITVEVMDNMATQMNGLIARIESLELKNSKYCATLTGLYANGKKSEIMEQVRIFFQDMLKLQPAIEDAYQLGTKEPKPIVIIFQSLEDKREVMRNKSTLNNFVNKDKKKFFLQDYQPIQVAEKRRRERHIIEQNDAKQKDDRLDIQRIQGGITIQGQVYKKKVEVPTPREMASITLNEYDAMMKTKMKKGISIEHKNSKFVAFTKSTNSYTEIRELYKRMKLTNPGARHIICAYIIQGEEDHYCKDYCDDDEPGAGRVLLKWMESSNLMCRVFFIARYYGNIKLGTDRFECYLDAAKAIFKQGPDYNHHLNINQHGIDTEATVPKEQSQLHTPSALENPKFTGRQRQYGSDVQRQRGGLAPQYSNYRGARRSTQSQPRQTYNPPLEKHGDTSSKLMPHNNGHGGGMEW